MHLLKPFYALVSLHSLYLYKARQDARPTHVFYLKDVSLETLPDEMGNEYFLKLENKFGNAVLAFDTEKERTTWLNALAREGIEASSSAAALFQAQSKKKEEEVSELAN